ncbi:hypothetical protein NKG95_28825 [Mesorhizobium sp. M1423]|uniref:hypothetical protein n=1 Tax=Mesorhizobium sp. M1423 TaxID=2957101 RepID=UPI00333BAAA4
MNDATCEAAMCLWEAMLEVRMKEGTSQAAWAAPIFARWDQWGTCEMRHDCIALAPIAERVWVAVRETGEEDDLVPFDWEFIPAFLRRVKFTDAHCSYAFETIDEAAMVADLLSVKVPNQ